VDHQLALAQREVAAVEQAAGEELAEQPPVARQRGEQHQRRHAGRHRAVERGLHLGREGRGCGGDAGGAGHGGCGTNMLQRDCYHFGSIRECKAIAMKSKARPT
jgi:hypothetical protein